MKITPKSHDTDKTVTTGDAFVMRFRESALRLSKMEKVIEAARQDHPENCCGHCVICEALKDLDGENV